MSQRLNRRARLLSGAAFAAAALVAVGNAQAQTTGAPTPAAEAQPAEVEEIVVTGIRRAIEASISAKASNTSIVEVISAEDIGKLPDVSIAESLARLPGVTSQRLDGRSQLISIRGLGPDFTTALLNGRELVTTGDNRGVEFDQFPSELLSSVVVYKTPDAALVGQGLAGTVDLRTIRPMDTETVINSVKKTGRAVTVEEGWQQSGVGSEVAARIMEHAFDYLDAPVARVSGKDVPMPYAANLEKLALPSVAEVVAAAKAVSYR